MKPKHHIEKFQAAVADAIRQSHARGVSAYQARDGYIVELKPNGEVVRLQEIAANYSVKTPAFR